MRPLRLITILRAVEGRAQEGAENLEDISDDALTEWVDPVLELADQLRGLVYPPADAGAQRPVRRAGGRPMSDDRTTLDAGLPDGATVGKVALEQSVAVIRPVAGVQISPMTQAQRDLNVLMDEIDRLRAQRDEGSATAYQRWTAETAIGGYPEAGTGSRTAINYAVIGLNDEAGEVAGKWKKLLRGDDVNDEARQARITALQDEVGDVLWYAARIAEETGTTLDALMARNRAKLMDRKRRGVIKGDGDRR